MYKYSIDIYINLYISCLFKIYRYTENGTNGKQKRQTSVCSLLTENVKWKLVLLGWQR